MSVTNGITLQSTVELAQGLEVNFLHRTCRYCKNGVTLGAGDVLFGDQWYHGKCWEMREERSDAKTPSA
jgi:hypothetical protein